MKKNHFSWIHILVSISLLGSLFNGCTDKTELIQSPNSTEETELKAHYNNGAFDWTNGDNIIFYDNRDQKITIPLPWSGTHSIGIPDDWKYDGSNNGFYGKEYGWELVYSNINVKSNTNKFFALYNKYTGKLRFFFYAMSGNQVASNVYLGLSITKATSFFNFSDDFANGMDIKKEFPLLKYSPQWTFGGAASQVGYASETWYGLEVDCAYDPDIVNSNFTFKGGLWAANISSITGTGITTGSITGSITSVSPNSPSFNLDFSNSQTTNNTVNNTTNLNKGSVGLFLGQTIDVKSGGDSFFKKLKENLVSGATKGAESAIKGFISGGGTEAVKVMGSLVNSIMGGGGKTTKSIVDLSLKATTNIELTSKTDVPGWDLGLFPVAGSITNDAPLYNKPLGVWNINTPKIVVDMYGYEGRSGKVITRYSYYTYKLQTPTIILNPEIAKDFKITNQQFDLVAAEGYVNQYFDASFFEPLGFINGMKLYRSPSTISSTKFQNQTVNSTLALKPKFYVRVFFLITHKTTGEQYSYSRYFNAINSIGQTIIETGSGGEEAW